MDIVITFDGNKKVNAQYKGHIIRTDQAIDNGGDGTAPEPFALFLASLGTCSGIYVKSFCDQRGIPTENIRLIQKMHYNPDKHRIDEISIDIELPPDFPEKYKDAVINTASLCAVKKVLMNPPEIKMNIVTAGA